MRLAMSIDLTRCVGCQACVSACKEQWDSGPGAARDWVHTFETGTRGKDLAVTFYPGLCMQCEEHPCTLDCPTGATYADPRTGVVMVDADLCIGCGSCLSSCPYGARHVDPVKKIVEKCNLCAPFVARGEQPACVQTCPAECRVFGDLDDPDSAVSRHVRETGAKPLAVAGIDVRPKTTYTGAAERERILAQGVVKPPERSGLARAWAGVTLPLARTAVPALGAVAIGGGLLVNLKARVDRVRREEGGDARASSPQASDAPAPDAALPRHRLGMRLLHWFNASSWVLLLVTGIGLMAAPRFAFFGTGVARAIAGWFGGPESLIRLHVGWGLVWAVVIIPVFLLFKRGVREVVHEVRVTRDDLVWLVAKPLAMAGLRRQPLPPQDKYNAGQKLFAIFVLVATSMIIASGLVMVAHVGPPGAVAAAILVHELSIALVVAGLAIHVTMAAVIADERPALRSMITGRIDYHHAAHHSPKWVAELEGRREARGPTQKEDRGER
jgi:sulfite dehydrogenase (quinone) subunit SoeB